MVVSTGRGGRHRARRAAARRPARQRRPHRPRHRRARRAGVPLRRPRVPGGGGVRDGDGRHHRPAGAAGARRRGGARRDLVGRAVASVANLLDLPLAVVSGSVALGFGDPILRRGPGRDGPALPAGVRAGRTSGPRRAGRPRSPDRCGPGRAVRSWESERDGTRRRRGPRAPASGSRVRWGRDAAVVARAVLSHPSLWWAAVGACGGWRGAGGGTALPSSRCPGRRTGASGSSRPTEGTGRPRSSLRSDVVAYLRWCQRSRPRRG